MGSTRKCKIEGCDKFVHGYDLCHSHLRRYKLYGDPLGVALKIDRRKEKKECSIDGCSNKAYCRGWCSKHYSRWKEHRDPTFTHYLEENPKTLSSDGTYYILSDCKNRKFLIDVEDWEKIKIRTWTMDSYGYMVASIEGKAIKLHRFLLGDAPKDKPYIDHKNRFPMDNRKKNLHWVTSKQNSDNKKFLKTDHVHKVKHNKTNPFYGEFVITGKRYKTKYFPTYETALKAINSLKEEVGFYNNFWEEEIDPQTLIDLDLLLDVKEKT